MALDLERIVRRTSRDIRTMERAELSALQRYLTEAHRRLQNSVRQAYTSALDDVAGRSAIFAEARARELLAEVDIALQALALGEPGNPTEESLRNLVLLGREIEHDQTTTVMEELYRRARRMNIDTSDIETMLAIRPGFDMQAVEAQVRNGAARLRRYSTIAIDRINQAVVDGLVAGRPWRPVAQEIRKAIVAPDHLRPGERIPAGRPGGLAYRARMIARTELQSSLQDARNARYAEAGIDYVVVFATEDEETCAYCGDRSGNIYRSTNVHLPYHPHCRCVATAVKKDWLDGGLLSRADFAAHRSRVLEEFRKKHGENARFARGPAPFERAAGMTAKPTPVNL